MVSFSDLPLLNAILNTGSTLLIIAGYRSIRANNRAAHRKFMLAALVTSSLFLLSYLVYHFNVGSVSFKGTGPVRVFYFAVLITHTVLAITLPVVVPLTVSRAWRNRFEAHKKIARVTLPIWLYVSATGVLIYVMLYLLKFE